MAAIINLLKNARFLTSSPSYESLPARPPGEGAEVAFAGRSNAGKSSVLNTITGSKGLAKTSSTPGKTRHINLFGLDERSMLRLADLPGYGYAKVGAAEQRRWAGELTRYVMERDCLKGVVIVMDVRHPLTDNDRQMIVLCRTGDRPVHVLLNKSDKLGFNSLSNTVREVKKELAFIAPGATCSTFSVLKNEGLTELRDVIGSWLGV
jgi:GTP-binding protein